MKTSELTGPALNWAVATAEGLKLTVFTNPQQVMVKDARGNGIHDFNPCENPSQAYPIIERENISIIRCDDDYGRDEKGFCNNVRTPVWAAEHGGQHSLGESYGPQGDCYGESYDIPESDCSYGQTPLIAAMRCYVASKLGDEVEIPDELR